MTNFDKMNLRIAFSLNIIDDDPSWESLVSYWMYNNDSTETIYYYKVFDHDGTELLSGSGLASYGYDGNSTYFEADKQHYFSTIVYDSRIRCSE